MVRLGRFDGGPDAWNALGDWTGRLIGAYGDRGVHNLSRVNGQVELLNAPRVSPQGVATTEVTGQGASEG